MWNCQRAFSCTFNYCINRFKKGRFESVCLTYYNCMIKRSYCERRHGFLFHFWFCCFKTFCHNVYSFLFAKICQQSSKGISWPNMNFFHKCILIYILNNDFLLNKQHLYHLYLLTVRHFSPLLKHRQANKNNTIDTYVS